MFDFPRVMRSIDSGSYPQGGVWDNPSGPPVAGAIARILAELAENTNRIDRSCGSCCERAGWVFAGC